MTTTAKTELAIGTEGAPGYFGAFGGRFVPETLIAPLEELTAAFDEARNDPAFQFELRELLARFSGRPTPVYFAERMSRELGGAREFYAAMAPPSDASPPTRFVREVVRERT